MAGRSVQMGGMLSFLSLLCVCLFLLQSTDCKAVIRTEEGCSLDSSGFSLHIGLRDAYLPRMWVEKHPEKESEVCSFLLRRRNTATCDSAFKKAEAGELPLVQNVP